MLYMKKATTYEDKINNLVNKIKKADVIYISFFIINLSLDLC